MKNKKLYLALCVVAAIAAFVGILFWIFAPDSETVAAAGSALALLCGVVPAAPIVTDPNGPASASGSQTANPAVLSANVEGGNIVRPEVNKPTVSQTITKVMPSLYPLDTMLRELRTGKTKSDIYEYFSVVARGTFAKVKSAGTETAAPAIATVSLDSAHMLSLDGNLIVPEYEATSPSAQATKVSGGVAKRPLVLHIVGVNYANQSIEVIALNASHVPAFAQGTVLYRGGTAKDQLAAMSDDPQILPTKDFNYCQINMCTISQSKLQALQEKEVAFGMAELQEQAIMDFRYQNEVSALFGYGREIIDPKTQKAKYTMSGFVQKVSKFLTKGSSASSLTKDVINGWMADIFDCNNGSDTRVMLYGADFATAMANSAVFEKQLEAGKTEIKFGLKWNSIETNHGTLLCRMHTGLGMNGYGSTAMVIDPANIRRVEQMPLTEEQLDLDRSGRRRTDDVRLMESFTLEVTNPDTHAVLFA